MTKINLLSRIVRYHEDIAVFRRAFAAIAGMLKVGKVDSASQLFTYFSQKNIDEHFEFEEDSVFKTIETQFNGYDRLIAGFVFAHKNIRLLRSKITEAIVTGAAYEQIFTDITRLFALTERHALYELESIVPLFTDNQTADFLLGRTFMHAKTGKSNLQKKSITDVIDSNQNETSLQLPEIAKLFTPVVRRSNTEFVSEIEGYTVIIDSPDSVSYIAADKMLHCRFRRLANSKFDFDDKEISGWETPHSEDVISDVDRIIISSRIDRCLKMYFSNLLPG